MKYELTFLTKEETELKNIKDLIDSFKGKVTSEEKWGCGIGEYEGVNIAGKNIWVENINPGIT